jgi:FtsZ-interacting cell division protein YlmF
LGVFIFNFLLPFFTINLGGERSERPATTRNNPQQPATTRNNPQQPATTHNNPQQPATTHNNPQQPPKKPFRKSEIQKFQKFQSSKVPTLFRFWRKYDEIAVVRE